MHCFQLTNETDKRPPLIEVKLVKWGDVLAPTSALYRRHRNERYESSRKMTQVSWQQALVWWRVLLRLLKRTTVTATVAIGCLSAAMVANAAQPPITAAAFSPSGTNLVMGSQSGVKIIAWPIDQSKPVDDLATELENVHHISFSPDGRRVLVAGGSPASRGVIELWSWPQMMLIRRDVIGDDVIYQAIWSSDSSKWVAVSADSRCRVVEAETGKELLVFEDHSRPVLGVDWVGDDGQVVTVGVDQTMRLWDSITGKHLRTLDNHLSAIQGVTTVRNSQSPVPIVATFGEDQTVRLWQPTIGRMMRFIKLTANPKCAVISSDGKRIHVGCQDGHLRSIDLDSMRLVAEQPTSLDSIFDVLLTNDGTQVIVTGIGGYDLINIAQE
jgi:WD40 repeat protein